MSAESTLRTLFENAADRLAKPVDISSRTLDERPGHESMTDITTASTWSNWVGNQKAHPGQLMRPTTLGGLQATMADIKCRKQTARMVGDSCAWSPLVPNDDNLVFMDGLRRVLSIDPMTSRIRVEAGARMGEIAMAGLLRGVCLPTTTVTPWLTIGGALAACAHGTGKAMGSLADVVVKLELVRPDGGIVVLQRGDPGFEAMVGNLGAGAALYAVTLQGEPMFRLRAVDDKSSHEVIDLADPRVLGDLLESHDYVEIYWWPFTKTLWLKLWDRTTAPATEGPITYGLDQLMLWLATKLGQQVLGLVAQHPILTPSFCNLSLDLGVKEQTVVADAPYVFHYQLYYPRVQDLSYAIPVDDDFNAASTALMYVVGQVYTQAALGRFPQNMVVHARYVPRSRCLLSPTFQGRSTFFVELLTFQNTPGWKGHYQDVERGWWALGGLPHWGKLFPWGTALQQPSWGYDRLPDIRRRYQDRLHEFERVRRRLDPGRVLSNAFTRALFGR